MIEGSDFTEAIRVLKELSTSENDMKNFGAEILTGLSYCHLKSDGNVEVAKQALDKLSNATFSDDFYMELKFKIELEIKRRERLAMSDPNEAIASIRKEIKEDPQN